MIKSGEI